MGSCRPALSPERRAALALLPASEAETLAGLARALADPIRLQMVRLLEQQSDLCTCEFERILGLSQSKVSYHLKVLLDAGVVTRTTYGTWSHYTLRRSDALSGLRALMDLSRA